MARQAQLSALVLAGGGGRRMGGPKAELRLAGERLIDRAIRIAREHFVEVLVSRGAPERGTIPGLDVQQVTDRETAFGPMAGLEAGLRAVTSAGIVTFPVDMPLVAPAFLSLLAQRLGDDDALVTRSQGGLQPLLAAYSTRCLPAIEACIDRGEHQVFQFHSAVRTRELVVAQTEGWRHRDEMFLNINTPADLERARMLLESAR